MNREIKFRGKVKCYGFNNWIYGFYFEQDIENVMNGITECHGYIISSRNKRYAIEVNPETVGQYTGFHDRFGNEIYEGDIVYCQTKFRKAKAIIKFIDGKFVAYWDSILTHPQNGHCIACYEINKRFEVIGNIYDNPELLGGE